MEAQLDRSLQMVSKVSTTARDGCAEVDSIHVGVYQQKIQVL